MRFIIHSICSVLISLAFISPVHSFDDDSRDDTRSASINSFCENKQVLNDTPTLKSSCQGDIVNLQRQNSTLVKNGKPISRSPVLDFKLSRNGKVYYRTRNGRFLYNESGRLKSLGGAVIIYLVSSNGDVVYLNNQGIVFKNGAPLNQNQSKVIFLIKDETFSNQAIFSAPSLAIARTGQAIYINDLGRIYVDNISMSSHTAKVLEFKTDSQATIFYLDDLGRLYKNSTRISHKPTKVKLFRLNSRGKVAFLTDGKAKNLYFEGRNLSAGAHRILDFNFTGTGEVIYRDDLGRIWKAGRLISK
jgi:hypothetical protein